MELTRQGNPEPGLRGKLCEIMSWEEHLFHSKECLQSRKGNLCRIAPVLVLYDVSVFFNVDLLRDKKAPAWSKDGVGRSRFFIDDTKVKIFEAHDGREYLHSAGGRKPAVGLGLLISCSVPVPSSPVPQPYAL